ncbi:30S ribosome-binding factor RbfA [Bdellovibrionota bacterium FG-1]
MQENRRQRLQSVIQQEISQFVSREVKDPRIPPVTFTEIQVTQDGSHAVVFVSILGGAGRRPDGSIDEDPKVAQRQVKECLDGLIAASGFIRRHLARVLNVRHTPTLVFREDRGFENSNRVHELLHKLVSDKPSSET